MIVHLYRYGSDPIELAQILRERRIQSRNAATAFATWYTFDRYDDPAAAQQFLALRDPPVYRVGPVWAFDVGQPDIPPRPVAPANGQPGGGTELRVVSSVWIFGVWNYQAQRWEL